MEFYGLESKAGNSNETVPSIIATRIRKEILKKRKGSKRRVDFPVASMEKSHGLLRYSLNTKTRF
jgi:hypothetical protein